MVKRRSLFFVFFFVPFALVSVAFGSIKGVVAISFLSEAEVICMYEDASKSSLQGLWVVAVLS